MVEAHERARSTIERWRRSEGEAVIASWGSVPEEERPAVAWPVLEAETFVAAELPPAERGAAAAHLARALFERTVTPFRRAREREGLTPLALERDRLPAADVTALLLDPLRARAAVRALEPLGRSLAERAREAQRQGMERAGRWLRAVEAGPHPDGGPAADRRRAAAEALLVASQGALTAVRSRFGVEEAWQWPAVLRGERALFRPERRFQRIAADVEGWGLRTTLASHVRVAAETPSLVRSRVAVRRMPERVRVAGPALDGVAGEWLAAEGLGRALALALVSPAAPSPLRWPVAGTVSRALGGLLAQVACDPIALGRRGLTRAEARAAAAAGAALTLLRARLDAAAVLAQGAPLVGHAALVARAIGTDADPGAAFVLTTSAASARFRATEAALRLFVALRERFDEDFFRNPRAAEPIRGAAARGGAFSAEAFAEEVGADSAAAHARLDELAEQALG